MHLIETVNAGARIINLSLGLLASFLTIFNELEEACYYARKYGVILVSSSGNQGNIGHTALFNNRWIIPVAACNHAGRLSPESNFGSSIGKRGFVAPGVNIRST
jgi:subtilisin family serine protease